MTAEATPHLDADHCLDLLQDLVAEPERARLLAHAARCAACEELLRGHAMTRERLRAQAPEALRPSATPAAAPARAGGWSRLTHRFSGTPAVRAMAAFGTVAVLVVAVIVARDPRSGTATSSTAPQVHWLPGAEADVVNRASWGAAENDAVRAGVEAYARRDLEEARRILGSTRSEGALELLRRVFLGSAAALQDDFATAEEVLARIPMEDVPEPWRGEARWTLYAAYEARGARAEAESLLALIAAGPGPVSSRARERTRRP